MAFPSASSHASLSPSHSVGWGWIVAATSSSIAPNSIANPASPIKSLALGPTISMPTNSCESFFAITLTKPSCLESVSALPLAERGNLPTSMLSCDCLRRQLSLPERAVRQHGISSNVADRVNAGVGGLELLVYFNEPLLVLLHLGFLQSHVFESKRVACAGEVEYGWEAFDDSHAASEFRVHSAEFDSYVPAPYDEQALGYFREFERFLGTDDANAVEFESLDLPGFGASGNNCLLEVN